jgi:hypothetical protein
LVQLLQLVVATVMHITAQVQTPARLVALAVAAVMQMVLAVLEHQGKDMQVALVVRVLAGKGLVAAVREQSEQTL